MGFGPLRVINDDRVAPGRGFGKHPHRDMEIVSYVVEGALEHRDSMGNGSVIRPGEVQRMSAGTGVTHSEYNHSKSEDVRFLQVWIVPFQRGLPPSYEQRAFDEDRRDQLRLVASGDGRRESITLHRDVGMYATLLGENSEVSHPLEPSRMAWLQVISGSLSVNEDHLGEGDGMAVFDERDVRIVAKLESHLLLFDLPGASV